MKIKNLEKFIRKIQKSFSKAGITTVIEKGLPPYDAYEIHSKFRDSTIKVAIIYRDGLHHCDITIYSTYFDTQKHLIEALRLIATSSCKVR
mgnify:CR=1 FL=1|jgi:hypothetical protein